MKKYLTILLLVVFSNKLAAQSPGKEPKIHWTAYLETYYAYDFGKPSNHEKPSFLYSFNRHNEVNLNLGLLKASYADERSRANIAIGAGTYMNANLAAEPGVLKNIYEANAGVKISKNKNLWVDAGIFSSHIGFESAIGKDCWTLTRSILAENSPYYESGVKVSYNSNNGKWFISGLLLNGWQRIYRIDGNNTPAFGHQVSFMPNDKITLNSSSFIGNDQADSSKLMRYFHNFYAVFQLDENWGIITGFDIGLQQQTKGSKRYNNWYAPVLICQYKPVEKMHLAARAEYYHDPNSVIVSSSDINGCQVWSFSLNYDYLITKNILWRIEGRTFSSKGDFFQKEGSPSSNNNQLITSLAISF
ncbi:hypothetical protein COR50_17140 [Chitinophaga caeni]|uniref:Porin n=1 Tax=Chitinophaga caeni TaxID=2029983 RepID=A0A291QXS8_9BACT|nr:porin [Chitinophaga caeni]ATL48748.1 hypothetical protein COR50_17140 [Chitinophaga caeni]